MIALIAAFLISAPAPEAPACPKSEPIQVHVVVILANDKSTEVDERLKEIAAEIRKKEPQFTGFELHKSFRKHLKIGEMESFDLVGKAKVEVIINEKTDAAGRMTITVKPPKLDEITYACTCGKFFPIITNHYTPENKRLIIAVMATPCKKKP